jgi:predicted amidohydrolase YtcJ
MHLSRRRFAGLSFSALAAACAGRHQLGEFILHGGPIYTGVASQPRVEALRIRGAEIHFAGAFEEARAGAGNARIINLNGAAAFPGFVDSHVHLPSVGMAAMTLDLVGTPSIAAMQASLAAYARAHPEGPIYGRGWIETHWPERRFPAREDLDAVVSDRPVILERIDGHASVANSAALALAGVESSTPDPEGGRIERNAAGAPTGMLIDNAAGLVQSRFPAPTPAMRREGLAVAARLYASRGWTGVANMSTSAEEAAFFRDFGASGELPLRAELYMTPEDSAEIYRRGPYGEGLVQVRGVKLYMDGALGSRGAALLAPYSDAPGDGLLVTPLEDIRGHLQRARERGVQVATHAIGDRGNRLVLNAYRDAFADDPAALRAARWRIEHAQVLALTDLPRFGSMGVIASMQPSHAISDLYFAPSRLGSDRLAGAYAWRSLLDSGAVIAAGSDAPVERGDPLIEFYAASYRHSLDGFADGNWHLQEAMSREQALAALTIGGAVATFTETERGTLEAGKRADVSVFSVDLMEAPPAQIPTARAVLTISDGRITHEAL